MGANEPPPLYKPELIEPKKKLTFLQHCYKEPWVPIGARARRHTPACPSPREEFCARERLTRALPVCARAGCLTTAGVLCVGFGAFIQGNKRLAQTMMRARVAAQGLTVLSMAAASGVALTSARSSPPEATSSSSSST